MSTPSVTIVEERATVTIVEERAAVVELEPQGDLAVSQAVALVEVLAPAEPQVLEVGIAGPQGPAGESTVGPEGPPGPPGEGAFVYTHDQLVPSDTWTIAHGLGGYPGVNVVDSAGTQVEGGVTYLDANTVVVSFSAAFSGTAHLS